MIITVFSAGKCETDENMVSDFPARKVRDFVRMERSVESEGGGGRLFNPYLIHFLNMQYGIALAYDVFIRFTI